MSLSFRPARPEELPGVALLAFHSFPAVGRSPKEWEAALEHNPHGGVEALWVGEEGGELIAACHLFRFRQWIGGERFPVMGLGTVAIAPTHRRRGLAARLLASGFRHALERGDLASALYPFRTSFYQRQGYGMAGEAHQYLVPPDALPDAPARAGVRLVVGDADRAAIRAVYDAWAPRQTGQMERGERAWEPVWEGEERGGVVYRGSGGDPEGYLVFRYRAAAPRGERSVEVEEIVWTTSEARRGLHAWLASLSDQWQQIIYRAHPDEAFPERLRELRYPAGDQPRWHYWFPAANLMMGPMFRLLDVAVAWRRRRVEAERPITLALEVDDEQLPANRGPWRLCLQGERVTVEQGSGEGADARLKLRVDVLSRIFIGALSPSAAVHGDCAEIDRPELLPALDRVLRLPRPFTFDRF